MTVPTPAADLVFGPQVPGIARDIIEELRGALSDSPACDWTFDAIHELPELWGSFSQSFNERSSAIPGRHYTEQLTSWFRDGLPSDFDGDSLPNIILTPLVVLTQLAQYAQYLELDVGRNAVSTDGDHEDIVSQPNGRYHCIEGSRAIGFCTGLLCAFAVASSHTWSDFKKYGRVALRLAMIVGAVVDAREAKAVLQKDAYSTSFAVAWRPAQRSWVKETVERFYPAAYLAVYYDADRATITASNSISERIIKELSANGVAIQRLGLKGRFHDPSDDIKSYVAALVQFCDQVEGLQFARPNALAMSTYDSTGRCTTTIYPESTLHAIALHGILTDQCDWYGAFKASCRIESNSNTEIVSFGLDRCVPSMLLGTLAPRLKQYDRIQTRNRVSPAAVEDCARQQHRLGGPHDAPELGLGQNPESIAVVGMAIKVAGADDVVEFSQILRSGQSQHQILTPDRIAFDTLHREKDENREWFGNFIRNPDAFDNEFFGYDGEQSTMMDPQQRLFLQAAYQAIEQAGYFTTSHYSKSAKHTNYVGVYVGACAVDYQQHVRTYSSNQHSVNGSQREFIASNVSRHFGWTGPSMTFDTTCSSSSVAIHTACRDLIANNCEAALVGGVTLITDCLWYQNLGAASFLSRTGQCKPFDADADGYCRGESIACVFLKRTSDALANGDQILGCIPSTAVLQNKNTTPLFVPNSPSLSKLFQGVISKASLRPEDIFLVEAHGTGTAVGDPAEWQSIRAVIEGSARSEPLIVGSVKGHVGHAEGASGVVSLIKILVMMNGFFIPPQASFQKLSPHLDSKISAMMEVPTSLRHWKEEQQIALINNYGACGSNASLIVTKPLRGAAECLVDTTDSSLLRFPFWVSAKTEQSLRNYISKLVEFLPSQSDAGIASVSFNMNRKSNRHLQQRLVFSCGSVNELQDKLESIVSAPSSDWGHMRPPAVPSRNNVILCFGGQASKHVGLSQELYKKCAILRHYLNQCDALVQGLGLNSIYPDLFATTDIRDVVMLQATLFASQYASAQSWIACGLQNIVAVTGYSFGELTALCVSGILSLEDAIRLVVGRARLIKRLWGSDSGIMFAAMGESALIQQLLVESAMGQSDQHPMSIACYNGPKMFTLAGSTAAANRMIDVASASPQYSAIRLKKLSVSNAFHCSLVDPLVQDLEQLGRSLKFRDPEIPFERATIIERTEKIGPKFIADHMRDPVYFDQALCRLTEKFESAIFLEAGFNSTITTMGGRALATRDAHRGYHFQALDLAGPNACNNLVDATVTLWKQGITASFWLHHGLQTSEYTSILLPPYQFEGSRHWLRMKTPAEARRTQLPSSSTSLTTKSVPGMYVLSHYRKTGGQNCPVFCIRTESEEYQRYVTGHTVAQTVPMCPATLQIDIAVEALFSLHPDWKTSNLQPVISDVINHIPMCLNPAIDFSLDCEPLAVDKLSWKWKIYSITSRHTEQMHVEGNVTLRSPNDRAYQAEFARFARQVKHKRCLDLLSLDQMDNDDDDSINILSGQSVYRAFDEIVQYDMQYRGLKVLVGHELECAGRVEEVPHDKVTWLDVPLSDSWSQTGGLWVNCMTSRRPDHILVATACEIIMRSPAQASKSRSNGPWHVYGRHTPETDNSYTTDLFIFDATTGELTDLMMGIRYAPVVKASMRKLLLRLAGNPKEEPSEHTNAAQRKEVAPIRSANFTAHPPLDVDKKDAGMNEDQTGKGITADVIAVLASVTGLEIESITVDADLADLGIDSLLAMEVARELESAFACRLTPAELSDADNVQKLVDRVASQTPGTVDDGTSSAATIDNSNEGSSSSSSASTAASECSDFKVMGDPPGGLASRSGGQPSLHTASPEAADAVLPQRSPSANGTLSQNSVDVLHTSEESRLRIAEQYISQTVSGWSKPFLQTSKLVANTGSVTKAAPGVVVLTGATGSLGSHLAWALTANPSVRTVVCLNRRVRGQSADERQSSSFSDRNIAISTEQRAKLHVLEADIAQPGLGLNGSDYEYIARNGTCIIHNAWPMSATRSFNTFGLQFKSLRHLLDLARDMAIRRDAPRIVFQFVSSIGVAGNSPPGRIREQRLPMSAVLPNGYCEAKWTCERILDETLHQYPSWFEPMVVRPGQIAGATSSGYWNPVEHFSFLVKSAQSLQLWPSLRGTVQWTPVDVVAMTMIDLCGFQSRDAFAKHPVYHIDHPIGQSWEQMSRVFAGILDIAEEHVVPFQDWLKAVRLSRLDPETDNPAARLADFFETHFEHMSCGGLILDTSLAQMHSPTLASLGPISSGQVRRYVNAWRKLGFLRD